MSHYHTIYTNLNVLKECIQINKNNTNILGKTKLPLIVLVLVHEYKNKQPDIPLSLFYLTNREALTVLCSVIKHLRSG